MKFGGIILFLPFVAAAQTNILTGNYDNQRTNANLNETILTPQTVGGGGFGKLGSLTVDGAIFAQPLYVSGVPIAGQGVKNVVYVATMNNSVYAMDADAPAAPPLWQVNLGNPVPSVALPDFVDISLQIGILSTPAIDLTGQAIYVVTDTFENGAPVFRLHALSLADGHEVLNGPVVIGASVAGSGAASMNGKISFDPFWHLQRPGLALGNGKVYVGFGSHGDAGPYHGWLLAYDASDLTHQVAVFNTTPNGLGGAIWQSGRAPAIDSAGNVYVSSGNGDFDGMTNFSGSVIKLSGADLSVLDWYAPAAWQYIDASENDLDVGSTGPILVPGSTLLVTGDKAGRLIYLDTNALGHIESGKEADEFVASPAGIFQLGLWPGSQGALLYEHDLNGPLKAYPVGGASINSTPVSTGAWTGDSYLQGMAVSANGGTNGIVWETTGDHSQPGVPATLHAFDAADLTKEIWNSGTQPSDALGAFAKFAEPLVAHGRVYVPTLSNQLAIYGLLAATNPDERQPRIAAVMNGASFVSGPISPGEIVAIMGANLGPSSMMNLKLDDTGRVATQLAGAEVWFDGIAAPLVYASSGLVGAAVPFGLTGASTQLVVQYNGKQSATVPVPVAPASPALFATSGTGSGEGLVVNEDGTVNSADNPAQVGSVVSFYATGFGQTTPPGQDGGVTSSVLSQPNLPVSVSIEGWPAYVIYAGAAPGMMEGVFQVNVRVPELAPAGVYDLISLQAGDTVSPAGVWMAVQ